jgi:heme exporter protein C
MMKKWLRIWDGLSVLCVLAASYMVFFYAPLEAVMGAVQRIFYFHVAAGWVGMVSFFLSMIASILFLVRKEKRWDLLAISAVEIGLVFGLLNIISGAIWARPIWNTWWTWDPRLTTAAVMELIYLAYFVLRHGVDNPDRQARFAALYAIFGFVSVPLTFLSIRLFRTIHPVVLAGGTAFDMTAAMLLTLITALIAFTVLFISLLVHRYQLAKASDAFMQRFQNDVQND